ncbi:unnamed protein product [Rotaria sp. Silwood2]|nr:unnamed protein product [Rotaria sp. Silwood2]CAF2710358.1 unnamed protein product [Rotaria sp. Silwood2]CAF2960281.1 unnamed protein product [Rotaria sp. Silwood2]CAF3116121.1 unnamed protein product [Rotaria sp. Silwood2]CAF4285047.1 unnamed protein product [Rotaria sp. Silwood2]
MFLSLAINVPVNTQTNIKIDYFKFSCRLAQKNSSFDECAKVCGIASGSKLNKNDCTLTFKNAGTTVEQYYPIALMIEDFYTESSYSSFSNIPVQVLIKIVSKLSCYTQPMVSFNLSNCTAISVGVQFNFTLAIQQGCSNTTIVDVFRTSPSKYEKK